MPRQYSDHETTSISTNFQSLVSVDRVISEIRRGRFISIGSKNQLSIIVQPAEGITNRNLATLAKISNNNLCLAVTALRARALNLPKPKTDILALSINPSIKAKDINSLINPLNGPISDKIALACNEIVADDSIKAGIILSKLARLLPAICFLEISSVNPSCLEKLKSQFEMLTVNKTNIFKYDQLASESLMKISETKLPLKNVGECRIINFRSSDGGVEHIAIIIGQLDKEKPILTRIHSECFTGDVLGSLRCDCGDQLHEAISKIAKTGSGILLYLRQEGRGLGLINKLRAYSLQDKGHDTYDANNQLGFDNDERSYRPAARILSLLNVKKIRLLTNNPEKISALTNLNVDVTERVQHSFQSNKHNETYLNAKKLKGHHLG